MSRTISGNIVDVVNGEIYPGSLVIDGPKIIALYRDGKCYERYIIPGLIDSHIHIESSMLVPSEFARVAVTHGTVATVSDPHEIANVLGVAGINFMIANSKTVPFKFYFGAPSSVPATKYETAGAELNAVAIEKLLATPEIKFLGEIMNTEAVLEKDPEILAKIKAARDNHKPVDGHAPGLKGAKLAAYVAAGISTDHETIDLAGALERIELGMKIQIREGSAAKNFACLHPLLEEYSEYCMFCSDDKHPDDLIKGHINQLVIRALQLGYDPINVLRCATLNPIKHYQLEVGLLQPGDWADLVIIDNLIDFKILETYIQGQLVAIDGKSHISSPRVQLVNHFKARPKVTSDFSLKQQGESLNVIGVLEGQLITRHEVVRPTVVDGEVVADAAADILKLVMINRYQDVPPVVGFIKGFGLKSGAIASSIAHDSHNIIAVGVSDYDLVTAVNAVIRSQGGLAVARGETLMVLALPVAGLMSDRDGYQVAKDYTQLDLMVKELGSRLTAPFMTLSFMSLLVIPELKLSDQGLFASERFQFTEIFNQR